MFDTEIIFLSHASILIKYKDEYLLTDPWFQEPAFGSWIPIPPMYVHPSYVVALKDKLSILVSHAHDDHCDNKYLSLFDKKTLICSSDFSSKGVFNRVSKLGFNNYQDISRSGSQIGSFFIRSFRNEDISLDDAMYTIRTPDMVIIHCNDNWRFLPDDIKNAFIEEILTLPKNYSIYFSQNNSASGFPTVYTNIEENIKNEIGQDVINQRLIQGMKNASDVSAQYFVPYAGYVGVFVKDKESLLEKVNFINRKYIEEKVSKFMPINLNVLDMLPGDIFRNNRLEKHFFKDIEDKNLIESSINFYNQYEVVEKCESYKKYENPLTSLDEFLKDFNDFVVNKVKNSEFYTSIIGKTLSINIVDDFSNSKTLEFGKGIVNYESKANLVIEVTNNMINGVIGKKILFENLHVGMTANFERHPNDIHHRDILMYITMFSYVYKR